MRISDWSSDVCSSDLDEADVAIGIAGYRAHRVAKYLVGSRGEGRFDLAGCRGLLARLQNLHGLDDHLGGFQEIGPDAPAELVRFIRCRSHLRAAAVDRKSTRLNSSH